MGAPSSLDVLRFVFACGGLALFLVWENLTPFREPVHPRARHYATNVALGVSNVAVLRLVSGALVFALAGVVGSVRIGLLGLVALPSLTEGIVTVVVLDLSAYGVHRWLHSSALLWRVHRIHHSDSDFDVTTGVRFHALEILLSAGIRAVMVTILGAGAAAVAIFETTLLLASQFQHSNLRFPEALDRHLRWITVTPSMHRIHHSEWAEEMNSNFSTIFSGWDRVFGSYGEKARQEDIVVGLPCEGTAEVGFLTLLSMPFASSGSTTISAARLSAALCAAAPPLVLDVRNPDEFVGELGHVEGAVLIPLPELEARLADFVPHRDRRIVAV